MLSTALQIIIEVNFGGTYNQSCFLPNCLWINKISLSNCAFPAFDKNSQKISWRELWISLPFQSCHCQPTHGQSVLRKTYAKLTNFLIIFNLSILCICHTLNRENKEHLPKPFEKAPLFYLAWWTDSTLSCSSTHFFL